MRTFRFLSVLVLGFGLAACGNGGSSATEQAPTAAPAADVDSAPVATPPLDPVADEPVPEKTLGTSGFLQGSRDAIEAAERAADEAAAGSQQALDQIEQAVSGSPEDDDEDE